MSRRIDIEITSTLDEGGFTWRAAGAKQPKGVVESSVLPSDAKVGDEYKVEVEQTMDGISVLSVVGGRQRVEKLETIDLLPAETDFQPVLETRARGGRGRNDRGGRRDRGDGGERRGRDNRGRDGGGRGDGRGGDGRGRGGEGRGRDGQSRDRRDGRGRGPRREAPPELPQRPKPKRLKAGKTHRNEVLATLPEEQRPIAEVAVQGMAAVRSRLADENAKAAAEGRPTMPEATVLKMAEDLMPRLRVAEWRDRAEAALAQIDHLDLRDLRSVVASAADPVVARDESTAALAGELKTALATKQEQELQLWFADIDAALAVGRVIRALRLSAQPPKAGVPFPVDIAERLTVSANAALTPIESPERWVATLEAAAFSPIHAQIAPMGKPPKVTDELAATVKRLGPALPQVAAMFDIEVDPKAPFPKPLRPDYAKRRADKSKGDGASSGGGQDGKQGGNRRPSDRDAKTDTSKPDSTATDTATDDVHADVDGNAADVTPTEGAASEAEMPPVVDASGPIAPEDEAEIVAEAQVVEEAEAIVEAAAQQDDQPSDDQGSDDQTGDDQTGDDETSDDQTGDDQGSDEPESTTDD